MSSKACWYCGGLPRLWWWLATLIGLPLLFFFMISDRQGLVESDLTDRVRAELISKEVYWAEVGLDKRGRDVMLSGNAPDEASRDTAIASAQNVYGVRSVEHNIDILPLRSPELSVLSNDGKVTLKGLLPTQGHIDSTVTAASEAFGADKVDNQLAVGERLNESGWITKVSGLMPALAGWKTASFDISDEGSKLGGVADTDTEKGNLLQQAKTLIGGKLEDGITIQPPQASAKSLQAATLTSQMAGGKLTLTGMLPTQQQADSLIEAAAQRLGADNIVNQLTVNADTAEPSWLGQAQKLLSSLTPAETSANIADGKLNLTGTVNSYQAHINALGVANAAIAGSELALEDNIELAIPAQPAAEFAVFEKAPPTPTKAAEITAALAAGKMTLKGTLGNQQEVDTLVAAAGQRVEPANVDNQLVVSDEYMPASWLMQAQQLISGLPQDSEIAITEQQATLSGTVNSYQAHINALGVANAAIAGSELTLADNITLNIPQQPAAEFAVFEKAPPTKAAEISAALTAGKITLQGILGSQPEVDALVAAAGQRAEPANVDNQLVVSDEHMPASWLTQAQQLISGLPQDSEITITEQQATLSGTVNSYQAHINALGVANAAIAGSELTLADNITLNIPQQPAAEFAVFEKAPPTKAAEITATLMAGKMTLKGMLGSQAEIDALVAAAGQRVEPANVDNQLVVSDEHMPASWLAQAQQLISGLPQDSEISITEQQATLSGTVDAYQKHINTLGLAQTALKGSELTLQDNITVAIPAQPEPEYPVYTPPPPAGQVAGSLADGKLTLTGTLANQQEIDTIVAAATSRAGEANVINQLQINDKHSPASWLENAKNLLLSLPEIKGMMSVNDQQAVFSGTTETNEDYIAAIRKARTAMQGQSLAFENNLVLDTSRIEQEAREKAEQERLAREKAEREEQERLAREKAEREEQERLAREKAEREEQERLAREKAEREEQERLAREKAEREEQERLAREKAEREEQERLAREKAEREEQERLVREKAEREEQERIAREKAEREEQERIAREKAEREEQERLAREKAEREEQERLAREKAEREEQERLAREKAEREEQERLAREKAEREEQERLAREKAEREEQERLAREKAEREEQERLAREKAEREEQERLAREKAEREEQERLAREKAEREEQERLAREKAEREEQERLAREKAEREEQERLAREKAEREEQERLAREKAEREEQERLAREKAEREEQERLAREKAEREEQERLAREKAEREEQERLAREKAEREEQERLAREKAEQQLACQNSLNQTMEDQTILFATNKADIKAESFDLLFELASIITSCEDALAGQVITIGGHTDSDGRAEYNLDLSNRRAGAVLTYLQNAGINTDMLEAKGFGEEQPVADNSTAEGRAQNRRITFEIRGQ